MKLKAKPEAKKLLAEKGIETGAFARNIGISEFTLRSLLASKPVRPATAKKFCDEHNVNMWDYFEIVE